MTSGFWKSNSGSYSMPTRSRPLMRERFATATSSPSTAWMSACAMMMVRPS